MTPFDRYLENLAELPSKTICTTKLSARHPINLEVGIDRLIKSIKAAKKTIVVGNGGSASIASHCASHYPRCGGLRIMPLNDISAITATANDYGYEDSYSIQLSVHADAGDLLIAISSSGNSDNIYNAIKMAQAYKCRIITFTGFRDDNRIRQMGNLNFYVPSNEYGPIELTHMALLHSAFDLMEGK